MECRTLLEKLTAKLLERCPLKYPIVRHLVALDPRNIAVSPENACEKMNYLQKKRLSADKKLVDDIRKYHKHEAQAFMPTSDRIDSFYNDLCHQNYAYPIPWAIRHREGILCQQGHSNSKYERINYCGISKGL